MWALNGCLPENVVREPENVVRQSLPNGSPVETASLVLVAFQLCAPSSHSALANMLIESEGWLPCFAQKSINIIFNSILTQLNELLPSVIFRL